MTAPTFRFPLVHRPGPLVAAFAAASCLLMLACAWSSGPGRIAWGTGALVYSLGLLAAAACWARSGYLARTWQPDLPARLLILAPHQDDCVFLAGGLGLRNIRRGGQVRIVYLCRDPRNEEERRREARAAWGMAGLGPENLSFHDCLPPLRKEGGCWVRADGDTAWYGRLVLTIREEVAAFRPGIVVMPLMEGGHLHHDLVAYAVRADCPLPAGTLLLEGPQYSPYVSLRNTPQRILSLVSRLFLGRLPYFPLPDGIDGRRALVLSMTREEGGLKARMLFAFASQVSPDDRQAVYHDRFYRAGSGGVPESPFSFACSLARLIQWIEMKCSPRAARLLVPLRSRTIGLRRGTTVFAEEIPRA